MNRVIAEVAKDIIQPLSFIHRLGGLVRIVHEGKGKTKAAYPTYCPDNTDCDNDIWGPDDNYRTVIYFEEQLPPQAYDYKQGRFYMKSEIRLVCWVNNKALGKTECSITEQLSLPIIAALCDAPKVHSGDLGGIKLEFKSQVADGYGLFSKYTTDKTKNFLCRPYDAFGLVISATWLISKDCVTPFQIDPEIC